MQQSLGMRLDQYLRSAGRGSLIKMAAALGVTPSTVSKWRYGRMIPPLEQALAIEKETKGRVKAGDLVDATAREPATKAS